MKHGRLFTALFIVVCIFTESALGYGIGRAVKDNDKVTAVVGSVGVLLITYMMARYSVLHEYLTRFRWKSADWPYDVKRTGWLARRRFPAGSPGREPQWCYLVMFDTMSNGWPSKAEKRILVSYLEFLRSQMPGRYVNEMGKRPFDIAKGFVWRTVILHKFGDEDWGYRLSGSFELWPRNTSLYSEHPISAPRILPLSTVLDEVHVVGGNPMPEWVEWKRSHPDVFS